MTERLTLATAPERPELAELLRKAAKIVMTPEQVREQRRSWVRGQIGLTHPDWPEEKVRRLVDEADERVYGTPPTSPPGFRDGIEAAAKVAEREQDECAELEDRALTDIDAARWHEQARAASRIAQAIRAIPTPDTLPTGWNPTHEHYRGGLYRVIARGRIEADLTPCVIYDNEAGETWVRPADDFDQTDPFVRFAALPPPPPGE